MTKLIIGSNSRNLGKKLYEHLKLEVVKTQVTRFEDGELRVRLEGSLERENVLIVQSTSKPAHDSLMELLLLVDAAKNAGARSITALIPYFGYSRQNNDKILNEPVSARLVAKLLEAAGIDRLVTLDLHAKNIEDFFTIDVHNVETTNLFADFLREKSNLMIVSPDEGGKERAKKLAGLLDVPYAVITKTRNTNGTCKMETISAEVKNYNCVLVDDIVNTGNTLCKAAEMLIERGALSVNAFVTHAVLSESAVELLDNSPLEQISVTETIEQRSLPLKFKILDIAYLLNDSLYF